MTIVFDMINLDHAYYYHDSKISPRKGNIRPYLRNNQVIINDNITSPLITQHTNDTLFTYESWLAIYIQHYLKDITDNLNTQNVMFIVPHYFNIKSIETAMNLLKINNWSWIYDYCAAAYHVSQKIDKNCWIIIPSEFETTVANIDIHNNIINNVTVLPYGSYFIKRNIKQYVSQHVKEISIDDAWEIYKALQISKEIDVANIILSIEKSFVITRTDLENMLTEYYSNIKKILPNNVSVAPFRWIGRDKFFQSICNDIITVYNPDEGICLGAAAFITNKYDFKIIDKTIYYDFNFISKAFDYPYLNQLIKLSDEFNSFVNMVDEVFIPLNISPPSIELTEESLIHLKEYLKEIYAQDLIKYANILLTKLHNINNIHTHNEVYKDNTINTNNTTNIYNHF